MDKTLEERINIGVIFLKLLGYKLDLNQKLQKWETINILNKNNEKKGNAYFDNTYFNMMGEDDKFKFVAKYKLKNNQSEDKVICNITNTINNTDYRIQLILTFKYSIIANYSLEVKMHVFLDNHQEFDLLIPDCNNSLIFDSFDEARGKEHIEVKNAENSFVIAHEKENKNQKVEAMTIYNNDEERIATINKIIYENGEDIKKRYYPLTCIDNLIGDLSYYMNEIDSIYKIPFWQLNMISNGILENLLYLSFPNLNKEDIFNLLGNISNPDQEKNKHLIHEKK